MLVKPTFLAQDARIRAKYGIVSLFWRIDRFDFDGKVFTSSQVYWFELLYVLVVFLVLKLQLFVI